jgi:hypothetical protein
MKERAFHLANFCLKKCLGESAQSNTRLQFERAYQPVRTNPRLGFKHKESGTHEKGCKYCARFCSCQEWSCLGEKSYESKIDERELYKLGIDMAERMRVYDMNKWNLMVKRALGFTR